MVLVLFSYEWTLLGVPQDRFWKIVRMPALPTVGMTLYFRVEDDLWEHKVDDVLWDEAYPEFFEVQIESIDCEFDPTEHMVASGWTHEVTKSACYGMRAHPSIDSRINLN